MGCFSFISIWVEPRFEILIWYAVIIAYRVLVSISALEATEPHVFDVYPPPWQCIDLHRICSHDPFCRICCSKDILCKEVMRRDWVGVRTVLPGRQERCMELKAVGFEFDWEVEICCVQWMCQAARLEPSDVNTCRQILAHRSNILGGYIGFRQ